MLIGLKRLLAVMLSALLSVSGAFAKSEKPMREFYVSPLGSDENDGTKDRPFRTLTRARDAVREVNADMTGDIVVHVGAGRYPLAETLTFDERDGAANGFSVRWVADGDAVLSGGETVAGFTLFDEEKNIYEAKVPAGEPFRQLYVNGQKMTRSRTAIDGSTRILGAARFLADGTLIPQWYNNWGEETLLQADYGEIYLDAEEFAPVLGAPDAEVHVLTAWVKNVLRVKSAEEADGVVRVRVKDEESALVFNRMHPNLDGYYKNEDREFVYYLENAYALIDEDNEWYYDAAKETVYLKVPAGFDLAEAEVTVPRLETLVKVEPNNGSKIANLSFEGLTFAYSNWALPSEEGLVDVQAGMYANYCVFATNDVGLNRPPAAVTVADTEGFVMRNCVIENTGAAGLDLLRGTKHSVIRDNVVRQTAGNGIMIGSFFVDGNTDMHEVYDPENESDICEGDRIVNNLVTDVGTDYQGAVGIGAGYPRDILIANNEVCNAPYTGISVGFGWSDKPNCMRNNRILNNEIHDTSLVLCDAGGIYTLSAQPGSEMSGNYIHDIRLPAWADYATSGIYMDEQTSGYTVKNNVIENAWGVGRNRNGENDYQENTVYIDARQGLAVRSIKKNAGISKYYDAYERLFYDGKGLFGK
ncbi:MAG: right-handed parallel beta-helix repeat-containing protein [Clostridia bacterium]|nr:right-handed parallel beta-helix repeat-containing protein [Clostridia bacterium]